MEYYLLRLTLSDRFIVNMVKVIEVSGTYVTDPSPRSQLASTALVNACFVSRFIRLE